MLRLYEMTSQVDSNGVDCFEYNDDEEVEEQITNQEAENIKEKLTVRTRLQSQHSWSASPHSARSVHSASSYQLLGSATSGEKRYCQNQSQKSFEIRN